MKEFVIVCICVFIALAIEKSFGDVSSTRPDMPLPADFVDLVESSDHIVVGEVLSVDLIDRDGNITTDVNSEYGYLHDYVPRLHVRLVEVIESDGEIPSEFIVPLWSKGLTRVLKEIVDRYQGEKRIFLLKGSSLEPVHPVQFIDAYSRDTYETIGSIVQGTYVGTPIGSATMLENGTIVLHLVASGGGGLGDAKFEYQASHVDYERIKRWVGEIKPNESKVLYRKK